MFSPRSLHNNWNCLLAVVKNLSGANVLRCVCVDSMCLKWHLSIWLRLSRSSLTYRPLSLISPNGVDNRSNTMNGSAGSSVSAASQGWVSTSTDKYILGFTAHGSGVSIHHVYKYFLQRYSGTVDQWRDLSSQWGLQGTLYLTCERYWNLRR